MNRRASAQWIQIESVSVFPAAEVIADDTARRRAVGMIKNELESQLAVFKKAKEPDKAKRLREETNRILEALGEDVVLEAPDSYIAIFIRALFNFLNILMRRTR